MRSSAGNNASSRPYAIGSPHANVGEPAGEVSLYTYWHLVARAHSPFQPETATGVTEPIGPAEVNSQPVGQRPRSGHDHVARGRTSRCPLVETQGTPAPALTASAAV